MARTTVEALVQQNPVVANNVFVRMDVALNEVLPESGTHERYEAGKAVGLAVVVAKDERVSYSPLDPETPDRLSFMADNRGVRPSAWVPRETDKEVLGGEIPEGMGRFTAFALAKINTIASGSDVLSYSTESASLAPGKVGIAGGQWRLGSLIGVSGLWEVHDHLVSQAFANEVVVATESHGLLRSTGDIAADLEAIFDRVKGIQDELHPGVPADEIDRQDVFALLGMADGVMSRHLRGAL